MEHALHSASLIVISLVLIVLLLGATELGRVVGRHVRKSREEKDASTLATGMLGIFALLIAFTYSLSLARYDARRQIVLEEANAIGTTANYALMLDQPYRARVMELLKRYTEQRIALGSPFERQQFAHDVGAANADLSALWRVSVAATAANPQSLPTYRFVGALNEQTNIAEARITALRNHVPIVVLAVLAIVAMVSLGFVGYSAAISGFDRYVGLTIMAVTIGLLIALTIDLDRPNRGSIEISLQPLHDALAALPPA